MALVRRSPLQDLFSIVPSPEQDTIYNTFGKPLVDHQFEESCSFYPYSVPNSQVEKLTSVGINLPPYNLRAHSHPFSKMLENHCLYVKALALFKKYDKVLLVSCKDVKALQLQQLLERSGSHTKLEIYNRAYSAKDAGRYSEILPKSGEFTLKLKEYEGEKDLVFFFDEMHLWGERYFTRFLATVNVLNIMASVVYPPEVLDGCTEPMNPKEYSFKILEDSIFCYPDGVLCEGYEQPLDCNYLFRKSSWNFSHEKLYGITMNWTAFDHHLFSIHRGLDGDTFRAFNNFDVVRMSSIPFLKRSPLKLKRVRSSVVNKMNFYLHSLKTGSGAAAGARMRQFQLEHDVNPEELAMAHEIFRRVSRTPELAVSEPWIISSWWKKFRYDTPAPLQGLLFPNTRVLKEDITSVLDCKNFEVWFQTEEAYCYRPEMDYLDKGEPESTAYSYTGQGENFYLYVKRNLVLKTTDYFFSIHLPFSFPNEGAKAHGDLGCTRYIWAFYVMVKRDGKWCREMVFYIHCAKYHIGWQETDEGIHRAFEDAQGYIAAFVNALDDELTAFKEEEEKPRVLPPYSPLIFSRLDQKQKKKGRRNVECKSSVSGKVPQPEIETAGASESPFSIGDLSFMVKEIEVFEDPDLIYSDDSSQELGSLETHTATEHDSKAIDTVKKEGEAFLKPNWSNKCLLEAIRDALDIKMDLIVESIFQSNLLELKEWLKSPDDADEKIVELVSIALKIDLIVNSTVSGCQTFRNSGMDALSEVKIEHTPGHFFFKKDPKDEISKLMGVPPLPKMWQGFRSGPASDGNAYQDSLSKGLFGIKSKGVSFEPCTDGNKFHIQCYFGAPGSGKSHGIKKVIKREKKKTFPVSIMAPKRALCEEWRKDIDAKRARSNTFENFLNSDDVQRTVVIDEVFQTPNGFVEAMTSKFKNVNFLVVTGDPLQASFYSPTCKDINSIGSFGARCFQNLRFSYYLYSYRLPQKVCKNFGITCLSTEEGDVNVVEASIEDILSIQKKAFIMVPSNDFRQELLEKGFDNAHTYVSYQGGTIEDTYYIVLDDASFSCASSALYTAATRGKRGYTVLNTTGRPLFSIMTGQIDRFMGPMLGQREINVEEDLKKINPDIHIIRDPRRGARFIFRKDGDQWEYSERPMPEDLDKEKRTSGDPWLQSMIDLSPDVNNIEIPIIEPVIPEPDMKVGLPLATKDIVRGMIDEFGKGREEREIKGKDEWSFQFDDSDGALFTNIYPRHRADDDLTFFAGVKKRLRLSNPTENMRKFRGATRFGKELFDEFCKHVKLPTTFDARIVDEAQAEFERKKVSKPEKLIEAHSNRSDPDWPVNWAFIFGKVQQCTKLEKAFSDAIAAQTIACFHHSVLTEFSWLARYIEKVVTASLPDRFYIHQKKNLCELDDWVKRHDFSKMCTESDFSAFDASQDAIILDFERRVMEHLKIPRRYIDSYISFKTHLGCRFGELAIMRFTGEFCTFMFNTLANMAFTFCKYEVNKYVAIGFAGDDMICNMSLKESKKYEALFKALTLKAKVKRHSEPTFCGWRLTRYGIVKDPMLLCTRTLIAIERGLIDQCVISYSLECAFAYDKKDLLYDIFTERDMEFHQITVRALIRHGTRSKTSLPFIKKIFGIPDRLPNKYIFRGHPLEEEVKRVLLSKGHIMHDIDE